MSGNSGSPEAPGSEAISGLERRALGLLGLARRSGSLVCGVAKVEQSIRSGRARIVLLSRDGSFAQKKGVFGLSRQERIPCFELFLQEQLAAALGMDRLSAVAVTDRNLARGLGPLLEELEGAAGS